MNEVVSITISEVPAYLESSEFYKSLEKNGDKITLAKIHYKPNLYVKSLADMRHLMSTMRFWGVKGIPRELIMYVANNPEMNLQTTLAEFTNELRCVAFLEVLGRDLQNIYPNTDRYSTYINSNKFLTSGTMVQRLIKLLTEQFRHHHGQIWNETTCELVARVGWLDCLTFLHENGCAWSPKTCEKAAHYNQLQCLKYAHENGCPWDAATTQEAIRERSGLCYQYARNHNCPWDANTCAAAAARRDLSLLKFAHENGCPWDEQTCKNAANSDSLVCLRYAREHGCTWDEKTCNIAAVGGRLNVLIYAHENGCPWDESACALAATGNHLPCLVYLHEQGCPWDASTCSSAAARKALPCLQYAHVQGCPWDKEVLKSGALHGSLHCLRYALDNGCPGRENACRFAHTKLESLRFLREEMNCPWDISVSNACAGSYSDHAECMRYCIVNGCPVDATTAELAATHLTRLQLLHESGCPWDERALRAAAASRSVDCLQYLLTHNCPGREDLVLYVTHHLPMLQCAHAHGCVLLPEAYRSAIKGDRPLQVVKFLFANGCPWPREVCTWFAQAKRADCLQFAHENGAEWDRNTAATAVSRPYRNPYSFSIETRDETVEAGNSLECLEYLHEEGCPWDGMVYSTPYKECLEYVQKHGCPKQWLNTPPRTGPLTRAAKKRGLCAGVPAQSAPVPVKGRGTKHSSKAAKSAPVENVAALAVVRGNRQRRGNRGNGCAVGGVGGGVVGGVVGGASTADASATVIASVEPDTTSTAPTTDSTGTSPLTTDAPAPAAVATTRSAKRRHRRKLAKAHTKGTTTIDEHATHADPSHTGKKRDRDENVHQGSSQEVGEQELPEEKRPYLSRFLNVVVPVTMWVGVGGLVAMTLFSQSTV